VSSPHPPLYELRERTCAKNVGLSPTLLLLACYGRGQWREVSSDELARGEMEDVVAIEMSVVRACREIEAFDASSLFCCVVASMEAVEVLPLSS
jgi:hypothetical protein